MGILLGRTPHSARQRAVTRMPIPIHAGVAIVAVAAAGSHASRLFAALPLLCSLLLSAVANAPTQMHCS
jgi:hypothetical protein